MAKGTTSKASGNGVGNALRDLGRSVTGSGNTSSGGGGGGADSGRAANQPSYSAMSLKGLTSSDPANVARNQAAANRYSAAEAAKPVRQTDSQEERERKAKAAAAAAAPAAPAVTPMPVLPAPTLTPPGAPAPVGSEAPTSAVEAAAMESTKGGRASTIVTGALGLLADAEATGQLRKRRSLMGGGLIK